MRPIKTATANQVFRPPTGAEDWCDPVWVERAERRVSPEQAIPTLKLTFEVEPEDLVTLMEGRARVELVIMGGTMPPVSLQIVPEPVEVLPA